MKILTVGDSWASAIEADTRKDAGWPDIMEVDFRQAIAGSTAEQWFGDKDGILTKAADTKADIAIVSLLGNDARKAMADGDVSLAELSNGILHLNYVVRKVRKDRTIVLLYADPFCGASKQIKRQVMLLDHIIMVSCAGLGVEFFFCQRFLTADHFDGKDIHPNRAGHEVIATRMKEYIELESADEMRSFYALHG